MNPLRYPSLYEINTRVWLTQLSKSLGRTATLDDIPDSDLDALVHDGFDWVWLLSVWQTGDAGQHVSRTNAQWRREFQATLPDLREEDIAGSGFAITGYGASAVVGGDYALARMRERLRQRGIRLMLDFVPNHTGLDHPWVEQHPEFYVSATKQQLKSDPRNYVLVTTAQGERALAHGRDPNFPGWSDTLQLNYGNPELQEAMIDALLNIAQHCDGVRCDMAMLLLPEVFERTWGIKTEPFWGKAVHRVREQHPEFCFLGEVYWDTEGKFLELGFDFVYDKRLYDGLRDGNATAVREHLSTAPDYQARLTRFLENHDEPRAASVFNPKTYEAAASITYLLPGLRMFHQGQLEGLKVHVPIHLRRAPEESVNLKLQAFYQRLLALLKQPVLRLGKWQLLECRQAWEGNPTWQSFIAWSWQAVQGQRLLIAVNYAPHDSQCYVHLPFSDLAGSTWRFKDLLDNIHYDRDGGEVQAHGLYLDVPPWHYHVFDLNTLA